jgi:hypothetical protein
MTRLTPVRALALAALAAAVAGCADTHGPRMTDAEAGRAPSRTVQVPSVGPDPTAVGPRGVLPDPYANPR